VRERKRQRERGSYSEEVVECVVKRKRRKMRVGFVYIYFVVCLFEVKKFSLFSPSFGLGKKYT
jgi:hypothetical protein